MTKFSISEIEDWVFSLAAAAGEMVDGDIVELEADNLFDVLAKIVSWEMGKDTIYVQHYTGIIKRLQEEYDEHLRNLPATTSG